MKKIPTLFKRDENGYVTDEVTPGCEWVLAGEGVATRKYNGVCVMYDGRFWWARHTLTEGQRYPQGWTAVEYDEVTHTRVGWIPLEDSDYWTLVTDALDDRRLITEDVVRTMERPIYTGNFDYPEGTYELVGPEINGNPEVLAHHWVVQHAAAPVIDDAPRDFEGLARYLKPALMEGIVFRHEDGRMAKIKTKDFRRLSSVRVL